MDGALSCLAFISNQLTWMYGETHSLRRKRDFGVEWACSIGAIQIVHKSLTNLIFPLYKIYLN